MATTSHQYLIKYLYILLSARCSFMQDLVNSYSFVGPVNLPGFGKVGIDGTDAAIGYTIRNVAVPAVIAASLFASVCLPASYCCHSLSLHMKTSYPNPSHSLSQYMLLSMHFLPSFRLFLKVLFWMDTFYPL